MVLRGSLQPYKGWACRGKAHGAKPGFHLPQGHWELEVWASKLFPHTPSPGFYWAFGAGLGSKRQNSTGRPALGSKAATRSQGTDCTARGQAAVEGGGGCFLGICHRGERRGEIGHSGAGFPSSAVAVGSRQGRAWLPQWGLEAPSSQSPPPEPCSLAPHPCSLMRLTHWVLEPSVGFSFLICRVGASAYLKGLREDYRACSSQSLEHGPGPSQP